MLIPLLSLLGGLVVLVLAADKLVDGAVALSRRFGVSTLVVGLTVVAYGTSLPEFIVSLLASFRGVADFAIGNIVGSNIANIGLVLGTAAAIQAIPVEDDALVKRDFSTVFVATAGAVFMMYGGEVSRVEGLMLLGLAALYTWWAISSSRKAAENHRAELEANGLADEDEPAPLGGALISLGIGVVGLFGGAHFMVEGATEIAKGLGIDERIIGLTVVALGTSLPELAASVAAAVKKHPELALGNVVGSCIFNLTFVLGGMSTVRPVSLNFEAAQTDMIVMGALTIAMILTLMTRMRMDRWEGTLLVSGYLGYLGYVVYATVSGLS